MSLLSLLAAQARNRFALPATTPFTCSANKPCDASAVIGGGGGKNHNSSGGVSKVLRAYLTGSILYGAVRTEYYRRHLFFDPYTSPSSLDVLAGPKMHLQSFVLSPLIFPFAVYTDVKEAQRYIAKDTGKYDVLPYFYSFDPFRNKRN